MKVVISCSSFLCNRGPGIQNGTIIRSEWGQSKITLNLFGNFVRWWGYFYSDPEQVEFMIIWSSNEAYVVDALAIRGDEGRCRLRKASGSSQTCFDPEVSEWGNPPDLSGIVNWIHRLTRRTRRTETSKYPQEKKSTEIPKVAASEMGLALKLQWI